MVDPLPPPGRAAPPWNRPAAAVPSNPESARQRRLRRAALISTLYHTHRTDRYDRAPFLLRPMPLAAAVDHLSRDPHLPARVQAAAWLLDHPDRSPAHAPYVHTLLRDVIGDLSTRLEQIEGELRDEPSCVKLLTARDPTSPTHPTHPTRPTQRTRAGAFRSAHTPAPGVRPTPIAPLPEQGRAARAYEMLAMTGCPRSAFHCSIHLDPSTLVTSITAHVEVDKPASAFNQVADPRGWETQAPLFWTESALGEYAGGAFTSHAGLGPVGSFSYENRELLEAVSLSWNPLFPVQGNNLLRATHYNHPELIEDEVACGMNVNLALSLSTTIGASQTHGGLDVDNGSVSAQAIGPDRGRTRLSATKSARFTERELCGVKLGLWLNLFAPFFLGPWIATLVYEGACFPTS